MSGAQFDKDAYSNTKEYWVEGNISEIGLTSLTINMGTQRGC